MDLKHLVPDPSIDDNTPTRRRGSCSSTPSINSTNGLDLEGKTKTSRSTRTRRSRPSLSRDLTSAQEKAVMGSGIPMDNSVTRRESASSMRTTSTIDEPVTYTPTTHRISKAKKGKRVHACEFPGCNKIFTRAEHRRRHELNHSPEASFPCTKPDCRKAFHRPDLLARHLERHELEEQTATKGPLSSSRRAISHQTIAPEPAMTPQNMTSPPMVAVGPQTHHSGPLTIGSLVNNNHPHNADHHGGFNGPMQGMEYPAPRYQMAMVNSSDESNYFYSSPESCQSPISEHYNRYNHRNSLSSASSAIDVYAPNTSLPVATTVSGWGPVIPANVNHTHGHDEDVTAIPSVDHVPVPLSNMDGDDWTILRRELGRAAGVVSNESGLALIDHERWSKCVDLYGQHFEPLFPVVTIPKPNFWASKPSPLLVGVMVGIGAQYDSSPNSKAFSMALLDASSGILNQREHITGRARLAELQTIFILEALNKFGSRRVDVETSPRFRFLYASLSQARHWVLTSPLAVFRTLRGNLNPLEVKKAHNFWIDHETRRRILQACLILDTLQSTLFGQQPVLVQFSSSGIPTNHMQGDMPFPCPSTLWENASSSSWASIASNFMNDNMSLRDATTMALSRLPSPLDPFQSLLVLSQVLMHHRHLNSFSADLQAFNANLSGYNQPEQGPNAMVEFTFHALLAAHYTPVRALLMVSGESWLYGKKVENQSDFREAKQKLRSWVDAGSPDNPIAADSDVLKALWHATRLLSLVLGPPNTDSSLGSLTIESFETPASEPPIESNFTGTLMPSLNMLHESWSIYLCSLICWACGLDSASPTTGSISTASTTPSSTSASSTQSSVSAHPPLLSPPVAFAEAHNYIAALTAPSFESPVDLLHLDPDTRGKTDGLLETIRTKKLSSGDSGLVNEAEGVLFRLVEKRGRGWAF